MGGRGEGPGEAQELPWHDLRMGHVRSAEETCLGPRVPGQEADPGAPLSRSLLSLSQGLRFHHYGVSGARDKDGFSRPLRTPGPPRYRPAADSAQSSSRKVGPAVAGPQRWQAKAGPVPRTLAGPGSPGLARNASPPADGRAAEERPSPFGIPYSKLSQAKHLKARTGAGQWASSDSKRRAQAPQDHKDP